MKISIWHWLKDEFRGFIGFDSCKSEREWSKVEISLLKFFTLLYTKTLEKNILENRIAQSKENFFNFFNMINDLLLVLDFEGNIVDINNNVLKRLNYSRKELLGKSSLMLHPEYERKQVKRNFKDIMTKEIQCFNVTAITKDGDIFPIEITNTKGLWNGKPVVFAVVKDVSGLTMSEEKFSKAFNNSGVSMFISRFSNGEILEVNDTFLDYLGTTKDEIIGKSTLDLNVISEFENRDIIKEKIINNGKISDMEIKIMGKENITRTGLTNIVPLNINHEKYLLSSIVDITHRVKYEEKLLELSNRDSLTNSYNRRYVYQRLEEMAEEYRRNDKFFSVAIIDIDNFKTINDKYGHQIGDYILKEFTKVINDNLRLYDILGRYGGEEFIVVLNHSNIKDSNMVLERILNTFRNKVFSLKGHKIKLTFSAGISSCEELEKENIDIDKLVGLADKRMYIAKNSGKNGIIYEKIS